jgi:ribonuclease HII
MSTATGRRAEAAAADYLRRHGFCVLECNWRTRWCEIDIVASKGDVVYFVEVKYRRRDDWGSGLEYVTHRKLRQMYFAAHFWAAQHGGSTDYRLVAVELTGDPPSVVGSVVIG